VSTVLRWQIGLAGVVEIREGAGGIQHELQQITNAFYSQIQRLFTYCTIDVLWFAVPSERVPMMTLFLAASEESSSSSEATAEQDWRQTGAERL
jgi:hypothetical protein